MKRVLSFWFLILSVGLVQTFGQLLPRQMLDATEYTKKFMTNSSAAAARVYLGITGEGGESGGGGIASLTPWTEHIDAGGYNLSNLGTLYTSNFNAAVMVLSNALPVPSGGMGRTNFDDRAVPIFSGTNSAEQIIVEDTVTEDSTNLVTQAGIINYVEEVFSGVGGLGKWGSGSTTNNDDINTLYTYSFPTDGLSAQLEAHIIGAGPTNIYSFIASALAKSASGGATIIGTNSIIIPAGGTNIVAYWDINAATARLNVRGTLSENISWMATNVLINVVTNGVVGIDGGGSGEPELVASDDFSSQAAFSDLGDDADWEAEDGLLTVLSGTKVVGNDGGWSLYRWVSDSFNSDQYATCSIGDVGGFDGVGVAVRVQDSVHGYGLYYNHASTTLFLVYFNGGAPVTVTSTSKTYSSGVQIRLRASGAGTSTRLNAWEDTGSGWVEVFTDQNPTVDLDNGRPGLMSGGANNAPSITDWTGGNW